jgi:hypothetical protein
MIQSDAENTSNANPMNYSSIEIIDSAELAKRLHLPESWVRASAVTIPSPALNSAAMWGSPELVEWWARHRVSKQGRNGGGF